MVVIEENFDEEPQYSGATGAQVMSYVMANTSEVLLPTAYVQIEHHSERFTFRALIDQGSQKSFIAERVQVNLQLPTVPRICHVSGMGAQVSQTSKKECFFTLASPKNDFRTQIRAVVLPKLTNWLPSTPIINLDLDEISDLDLSDPDFTRPGQIDLVLGSDVFPKLLLNGVRFSVFGSLLAQNTVFGWYLCGPLAADTTQSYTVQVSDKVEEEESLGGLLRQFWEVEEVPQIKQLSQDDLYCEELYTRTTYRNEEGRYIVKLPFKKEFPRDLKLGASKPIALAQFSRMESKLAKTPDLSQVYNDVLREYLTLGHMERALSNQNPSHIESFSTYYLPHHAVIRPESKTTKVRVVFNASQKTTTSLSLNDVLYTGPVLQADLVVMLLNWRFYRYVFNGDIEKMYRQILVDPADRKFQRILFRNGPGEPIQDYELKTVTFGVNCAPYLAIRTLLQLATDSEGHSPIAASILRHETYVDDVLSGGHSLEEALEGQTQLISTLQSAGFPLKKMTSNHPDLLKNIDPSARLDSEFLKLETTSNAKMLGIRWNALNDSFSYKLSPINSTPSATKRQILSQTAKIFDPAGWCTPIIIRAKMLLQQLWLEKLDWDDPVLPASLDTWNAFIDDLKFIENIQIPRWTHYSPKAKIQIHGFCDASERAYCAVIYLRTEFEENVHCHLLTAKSKVAPLQTISLPRLELCGALLLSNLIKNVLPQLRLHTYDLFLWTDSSIVISWLRQTPNTWKTYVANRVSQIFENVGNIPWRHVVSRNNPADLGTRGCTALELKSSTLWWNGPDWLAQALETWPQSLPEISLPPEIKHVQTFATLSQEDDPLNRFSSLDRALRVLAYVFRFTYLSREIPANRFDSTALTPAEIEIVKFRLIKVSQQIHYATEYHCLETKRPVSKSSSLAPLNPFLDAQGLIRINGRIEIMEDDFDKKFPIVIHSSSRFCRLLLEFLHKTLLHAEIQLMERLVRQYYYIPRLKQKIKKIIQMCKVCTIYKRKIRSQLMGALPLERTTFSLPFTYVGVDFAGPFQIKSSTIRNAPYLKGYACIFVCFATKAVHIEACEDLSTPAFRETFDRFVGRRGLPKRIYSDNGRNFIGANNTLEAEFSAFIEQAPQDLQTKYTVQGLEWHFIPPSAPHMGGLWEAAVKSFKTHLQKVAGSHKFTFQEFSTLLVRIEGVLNSRPLTPTSQDPEDLLALTPGHFMTGRPIMAFPETSSSDLPITSRYDKAKILHHRFSQRWKDEYLHTLNKRYKWKQPEKNLKEGEFVVIIDDQLPPSDWRMGRVVKVHYGPDNLVRVAEIRTQAGIVTRALSKLCVLPYESQYFQ